MTAFPLPVVEEHEGVSVVRDDLLPGGTKVRFLPALISGAREVVYGSPFCGAAAVALAVAGATLGVRVTVFYAKRKALHRRQKAAWAAGARIFLVPHGYMTNVQAKARAYAEMTGALFLPLGFDVPAAAEMLVEAACEVRRRVGSPDQVWCATGSGMLARCLAAAFRDSEVVGVAVGLRSRWAAKAAPANLRIVDAGVPFEEEWRAPAPFPCCPNYDRKAWVRCAASSRASRLFWNVMGD